MAVHRELGCGFLEAVYRAALACEFHERAIPFTPEVLLPITYKGIRLPLNYRVDVVCCDAVLVEVKALNAIGEIERAQALNYLRPSRKARALVLNFGARSLQHQRVVHEWQG
jgi:GxxExxY protein